MRIAEQKPSADVTVVDLVTVMWVTGLSRSAICRLASEGSFPPPVGGRPLRWRWSDVVLWSRELQSLDRVLLH